MSDTFQFIERARLLLEQGRVNDAVKQIKNALEQDPDNDMALALYARCQFDQKNFDGGIETLYKAIYIDPENSYYYYLIAFGYYRKDLNTQALEKLNQSIQLNPYFAESFGLMAYVYCDEKNFKLALEKANEGLAADPGNITCLNVRSIALNKMKQTDAAVETMEHALAQDPDNEFTHSTIGWNYLEKGNNKVAATHFREALRINPNMHNAKEGLKEALKSKIPPYKWLLQYSFWINNQGKKTRWIIPLALYFGVRILATAFNQSQRTESVAGIILGLYLVFVLTSWLINPVANFMLLFHKDGKYALNSTEKNSAISVVATLFAGIICVLIGYFLYAGNDVLSTAWLTAGIAFLAMALPLGRLQYPLSFNDYGAQNKLALGLTGLGLLTVLFAFIYLPVAIVTGTSFLVIFVINSWVGVFRK
jgi:tetratricopeptide (TPR) repeat protein